MAVTTPRFQLLDLQLDGQLEALMRLYFLEAGTWEEVARRLLVEHGKQVTGQTLRRWAAELGIGAAA